MSMLEPGRCNQNWGHMMTVENFSDVPANVWALGSLGGRIGGGGHCELPDRRSLRNLQPGERGRSAPLIPLVRRLAPIMKAAPRMA